MSALRRFREDLDARAESDLLRELPPVASREPGALAMNGRRFVDLSGNDYLALSHDPEVKDAAREAIARHGTGAGASRLVSANTPIHEELEFALCRLKRMEAALLFPSGFQVGSGFLAAAAGPEDAIFADRLVHACLIDGARASRAKFRVFRHNDVAHLAELLAKESSSRTRWVVVDGLYSMDGDIAPLPELLELCTETDSMLIADDAHATGTLGATGRGTMEHFGLDPRYWHERLLVISTLSKALGAQGGALLGARTAIDWAFNHARPMIYSTALAPASAAAALASIRIIEREPARVAELQSRARFMRRALRENGIAAEDTGSPIIPIPCGANADALRVSHSYREQGYIGIAIRPPTVPRGTSRLRLSICAAHTESELANAATTLTTCLGSSFIPHSSSFPSSLPEESSHAH